MSRLPVQPQARVPVPGGSGTFSTLSCAPVSCRSPVPGHKGEDIVVTNTEYWMGPDITVATATKGRVRAFGRVWDFDGRSAEICQIDWKGPR